MGKFTISPSGARLQFTIKPILLLFTLYILHCTFYIHAYAVVDPLAVPNNRFGIHIIQATPDESSPAASLVNGTGGDWGYITFLIESKDRNEGKWQEFFNDLRRRHLIPIVRLATKPVNEHWERPYEGEEQAWADFLDSLNWPVKNRYVIVYNEPNHAKEWGNKVDAKSYSQVLDKTITALKNKNKDFFVLNAGFDASAPQQLPNYQDETSFMQEMNSAIPGIFEKLDGWVSHSYPNPGFAGSPNAIGRGTVRTWYWELQQLRNMGVTKNLPVFITETGWKHAEGLTYNPSLPTEETLSDYYQNAFQNAWASARIAAITPFLLSYQESPFDHFSFKKITGQQQKEKLITTGSQVLGTAYPEYYDFYQKIVSLPKVLGKPIQDYLAELIKGEVYSTIVSGETYEISLTFKNTGQSIWDKNTSIVDIEGEKELGLKEVKVADGEKIEPGEEYTFKLQLKAPDSGTYPVSLNLFAEGKQFDSKPISFTTVVKPPVILQIKSFLKWKKDAKGAYLLGVKGPTGDSIKTIELKSDGTSEDLEVKNLLPDYSFEFSLEKPFYKPSVIQQKLSAGVNLLDFGLLQPDIFSALLNPVQLWKLLPWSP